MFDFYYVRDNCIAEDIASDSLVKLWQVMTKESVENIPCLLMTIIKNKALDYLKQIFEMSRYECMLNRQIAETLGISVKSVEYHITNALKKLRISLADYLPIICFMIY